MRLALTGWMAKTMVVYTLIIVGATGADWMLDSAGAGSQTGSALIGLVCALSVCSMPRPVVDRFVDWRVGAWVGRAVAAPVLLVQVLVAPLLPGFTVLAMIVVYLTAFPAAAWAIERWVQRHSHQQPDQESEQQGEGGDAEGGADGHFGRV